VIALIDYGAGNLASVRRALAVVGAQVRVPSAPADLAGARAVVVPGVGHFAATSSLDHTWREAIAGLAASGRPLLGICLGMQWLFDGSTEAPDSAGLGLLRGRCCRLDQALSRCNGPSGDLPPATRVKIPHVGWNTVQCLRASPLFAGLEADACFYFTHAYAAPVTVDTVAAAVHGTRFAAAAERGRVFGVQFHPEKSGPAGLRLLANFVEVTRS
jgi:glutamine amidotransferase